MRPIRPSLRGAFASTAVVALLCCTGREAAAAPTCAVDPSLVEIASMDAATPIRVFYAPSDAPLARRTLARAERSMRELSAYFGARPVAELRLYLAPTRASFNRMNGEKTEGCWVGSALGSQEVAFLAPSAWDADCSYIQFDHLIKHEMVHVLVNLVNSRPAVECGKVKDSSGYWFEEGLAVVVSGQGSDWSGRVSHDFQKRPHLEQILEGDGYPAAGAAVQFLFDTYGQAKVLQALRAMPDNRIDANVPKSERILLDTLGTDKLGLEAQWRNFVSERYPVKGS